MKAVSDPLRNVLDRLDGVKQRGRGYMALCPAHDDRNPSLSVREGDDGRVLVKCFAGCDARDVARAMGLTMGDLFLDPITPLPPNRQRPAASPRPQPAAAKRRKRVKTVNHPDSENGSCPIATYRYCTADGATVRIKARYGQKDFRWFSPAQDGGWYMDKDESAPEVLYGTERLATDANGVVHLSESEKDKDALQARDLLAVAAGGADNWHPAMADQLAGRDVAILTHNDEGGRAFTRRATADLVRVGAIVRDVRLPGIPEKGDVVDWLDGGGTAERLIAFVAATKVDEPEDADEVRRIAESVGRYAPAEPMATNAARKPEPHADDDTGQEAEPTPTKESADNRPMIDAGNHNLPVVTRLAWDALTATNDPPYLFQHAGVPSRLQYGEDGRILLVPLTEHRLRCEVALAAEWFVIKGKEQIAIGAEPPLSVIQNMLAGAELPLPILRSITETPVFAPDGRLIDAAGFDTASGMYLQPVAGLIVPPVPDKPTADDVAKARAMICDDLLSDFPFTEQADRAAAVALLLLPFVRAMIPGLTPMHGIESPTVGSGKGLLGDVLVRPAFGQHGGMIAEARDDDEWRKRIGAKLREGAPIIQIDNVTRPLDSGALAMALTAPVFSDRILGQTATFRATVRNIWMFTANNPVMSLEIARRTVRIRIDTNEEKPWQRDTFKHKNLRAWADTHRGDLIHAALTLVRAWIVAGKPMADVTLGSYEEWAATMGGILNVAGVPGLLANMTAFYETADLEGAAWRQFVARWAEQHGSNKVSVGDLFTLASDVDSFDFGKGGDRSQRTSFGAQLTKQRDRIYNGYRVTLAGTSRGAKQWRLLPVTSGGGEPRQQRFTTDSPDIATKKDEVVNLGEPFHSPPAEKKMDDFSLDGSVEQESTKVHQGSPPTGVTLTPQGKKVVNLDTEGSHDTEKAFAADDLPDRVALREWAEDEALGWENTTFPEAAIREATRRYYALTIPEGSARKEMADLIVAAMKGLPQ